MVPIETFNEAHLVVGPPECGKSYFAIELAKRIARRDGAYLVAHVVTGTLRGDDVVKVHDGLALLRSFRERPGGVHVIRTEDGLPALRAALDVASFAAKAAGGEHATAVTPVVFMEDEVCSFEGMSPNYLTPELKRAYVMRRHLPPTETAMMGFVLATQTPSMVHPTLWRNATTITIFKLESTEVGNYLTRVCGVSKEIVDAALRLKLCRKHGESRLDGVHYLTWDRYADTDGDDEEPPHQKATKVDNAPP